MTHKNRETFWRGFGSVLPMGPRRYYKKVQIVDVDEAARRDLAAVWVEVGTHIREAMDELGNERSGRKQSIGRINRDEACA